jgi:aminoglycoside 2'-N-acetyltransferase I
MLELCTEAYGEDFAPYLAVLSDPVHVLAHEGGLLVSHACWVTRWLQPGSGPLLRAAYVEAVATRPGFRKRGLASAVMQRLVQEFAGYDIAALSPSDAGFYRRLGWERWRGPLLVRTASGLKPSPDDEVCMIFRLAKSPELDLGAPLSIEWRPGEVW